MVVNYLAACAMVEDRASEIYRTMASVALANGEEELGGLWLMMATDEEDHAQ